MVIVEVIVIPDTGVATTVSRSTATTELTKKNKCGKRYARIYS
jgi:hypothetical protein